MPFDPYPPLRTDDPATLIELGIERIATPDRWCKRMWRSIDSTQWCGVGAVMAVGEADVMIPHNAADLAGFWMAEAAIRRGFGGFVQFNDAPETTHADVLACMREAAEMARAK